MIDTRDEYRSLFDLYVPIALAVFVIVVGFVLFAVLRYRRRDETLPRQRTGAPVVELLYAAGLVAVVALLTGRTFSVESRVDRVSQSASLRVDVTASKWKWRFTYPDYGVSETGGDVAPATLVVPRGRTVQFRMTSLDVIHSFFVPDLRFKRDAFPNRTTRFDLVFSRAGFTGRCAEFCGLHHADMRFSVEVMPASEFAAWTRQQQKARGPPG